MRPVPLRIGAFPDKKLQDGVWAVPNEKTTKKRKYGNHRNKTQQHRQRIS